MDEFTRSCVDCRAGSCNKKDAPFPEFCLTSNLPKEVLADAMKQYELEENRRIAVAAAEVEADNYCKITRLEETIEFAKKIGVKPTNIIRQN